VREYDAIRVTDERPAQRARTGAKLAADAGLGTLLGRLRYMCDRYGRELVFADTVRGFALSDIEAGAARAAPEEQAAHVLSQKASGPECGEEKRTIRPAS
jgi:hypothetical protein